MTLLLLLLLLWTYPPLIAFALTGLAFERSHHRIYQYAATMADRFDIDDPRGRAYGDMATVIALDGKAEPKQWADMRAGDRS